MRLASPYVYGQKTGEGLDKVNLFRIDNAKQGDQRFTLGRYPVGEKDMPTKISVSFGKLRNMQSGELRINTNEAVSSSIDKMLVYRKAQALSIPVPGKSSPLDEYVYVDENGIGVEASSLISDISTFPLILKKVEGEGGAGLFKVYNILQLHNAINSIATTGDIEAYMVQQFIPYVKEVRFHTFPRLKGTKVYYQYKLYSLDDPEKYVDKVETNSVGIAGIQKRILKSGEDATHLTANNSMFSNDHGLTESQINEMSKAAVDIMKAIGADFGAVDFFVMSDGRWVLNETNTNPGLITDLKEKNSMVQKYITALKHTILHKYKQEFPLGLEQQKQNSVTAKAK